jgi:hypothetical protein
LLAYVVISERGDRLIHVSEIERLRSEAADRRDRLAAGDDDDVEPIGTS